MPPRTTRRPPGTSSATTIEVQSVEHMHEHDTLDMQDIHRVLVQSLLFPSPFLRHLSRLTFLLMHDNNYQFDT